ncbi:hypothetical protein HT136_10085 [Novosphingobium profundi]|uniref:hypothetical protein n=1 Tax=Novosphingobium profundi TaxID=1774954 RepID=UPI001BDAE0F1|nr:hypothetical protein [Novosphingobium profundi]MBT0668716.1 hypothetical protein [Novosphingobium profundi]
MPLIWLGPLVTLGFIAGLMISAILLRMGRLSHPAAWLAAFGLPFACAALPILLLALLSLLGIFARSGASVSGL